MICNTLGEMDGLDITTLIIYTHFQVQKMLHMCVEHLESGAEYQQVCNNESDYLPCGYMSLQVAHHHSCLLPTSYVYDNPTFG